MTATHINTDELTDKVELITVSSRGQIVIPERVREKHGIERGDKLVLVEHGDALILRKEADAEQALRDDWLALSEQAFRDVWDNEDDEAWNEY